MQFPVGPLLKITLYSAATSKLLRGGYYALRVIQFLLNSRSGSYYLLHPYIYILL